MQNILKTATLSTSLAPFFGKGYMAVTFGSVVHIIQCTALDAAIDQSRDKCTSQIPISLYNMEGRKVNSTRYADPRTRILSPAGTQADSSTLLVSYKLDDGSYLCKKGNSFLVKMFLFLSCPFPLKLNIFPKSSQPILASVKWQNLK